MATVGCPTKYSKEKLNISIDYVKNYKEHGDIVPSVVGLAVLLEVSKKTLYNWAAVPENKDFLHTLEKLSTNQERGLLNGGLSGDLNPQITKMMLYNHGYSDKPREDAEDDESPAIDVHFHVKEPVTEIKVTNAKS